MLTRATADCGTVIHSDCIYAPMYHEWVYDQMTQIDRIANGNADTFVELYDRYVNDVATEYAEMVRWEFWE
jgi:hypothetical protein